MVSESLSNLARHSRASRATVELLSERGGDAFQLRIGDNGIGFDPARVGKLGHQGLANTRERASRIGAAVKIESASGHGTQITIIIGPDPIQRRPGARS
jgi:signal transduction histidine kinase